MADPATETIAGIEVLRKTSARWATRPENEGAAAAFRLGFEDQPLPADLDQPRFRWWHYRGQKAAMDWQTHRQRQEPRREAMDAGARARRSGVPFESAPPARKRGKAYRRDWQAGWRSEEERMYEEMRSKK